MKFNESCPCCEENKKDKETELIRDLKIWLMLLEDKDVQCLINILKKYVNHDLLS